MSPARPIESPATVKRKREKRESLSSAAEAVTVALSETVVALRKTASSSVVRRLQSRLSLNDVIEKSEWLNVRDHLSLAASSENTDMSETSIAVMTWSDIRDQSNTSLVQTPLSPSSSAKSLSRSSSKKHLEHLSFYLHLHQPKKKTLKLSSVPKSSAPNAPKLAKIVRLLDARSQEMMRKRITTTNVVSVRSPVITVMMIVTPACPATIVKSVLAIQSPTLGVIVVMSDTTAIRATSTSERKHATTTTMMSLSIDAISPKELPWVSALQSYSAITARNLAMGMRKTIAAVAGWAKMLVLQH